METRLLPISTVFGRFPRMVRDTAQAEGKRVRLVQPGGETPLDKAVLDRLSEPLLHLVTNAIVHGIESSEDRRAGRASRRKATLRLDASPQVGPGRDPGDGRRPRAGRAGHPQEGRGARARRAAPRRPPRSGT